MDRMAALLHERRHFVRFRARYDAEVRTDGAWHPTRTCDLSQGGVALSPPPPPVIPRSVGLRLYVPTQEEPIELEGAVRHLDLRIAHVQFEQGAEQAAASVRELAELAVVPELEMHIGDNAGDCHDLITLAGWYRELGRSGHALQLYRSARCIDRPGKVFYEHMAIFLLEEAGSGEGDPEPLLDELAGVIAEGRQLGYSATLEAVAAEANEWRRQWSPERHFGPPPPAHNEVARAEIERLRHSIRAHREDLYRGFSDLLAERRRLALLEQRRGALEMADDPEASGIEGLLESIEAQLQKLRDASRPDGMPAMPPQLPAARSFPRWPLAVSAVFGVGLMLLWLFRVTQVESAPPTPVEVAPPPVPSEAPAPVRSALATPSPEQPTTTRTPPPARPVAPRADRSLAISTTPPAAPAAPPPPNEIDEPDERPELPAPVAPPPPRWLQAHRAKSVPPATRAYRRGAELLRERKVLLAIEAFERAVHHDPEHARAYRALGVAYTELGRTRAAVQAFETSLRLDPEHRDAAKIRTIIDAARSVEAP